MRQNDNKMKTTFTQADMIALIVGVVLTITAVLVIFLGLERSPISPQNPPTVVITPAPLPINAPVMAASLPAGSGTQQAGTTGGGFGRIGGSGAMGGGATGGKKNITPQMGAIGGGK